MELLERDPILTRLDDLLADVATRGGRIVAVCGEAGVGKTSLVEEFTAARPGGGHALRGLCDALATPRPLGPLYDMAEQAPGPLNAALRAGVGRDGLFSAFLEELARPPSPRIVVVEDVHWADDATLDLLKYAGRRIRRFPALLFITYRDDEVGPDHPLHRLLGELPRESMDWVQLPLLSRAAVQELAQRRGRSAEGLYDLTGGNPFFVTEILASSGDAVPVSIRAAVLARAARLDADARELLDLLSVAPGRVERDLVQALLPGVAEAMRRCLAAGVLVAGADTVGFRHELARRAWQETLEPGAEARLHARMLEILLERPHGPKELPRIVHHADGARDGARLLQLAPAAAREAMAVGAYRQAAAHYATALRYANGLPMPERAALLEAFSYVRHMTGGIAEAIQAREQALALRRQLDDRVREGADLRWLSRLTWFEGRRAAAEALGQEAIRVLEPLGPTPELAMAYSNQAQLAMLTDYPAGARAWGERAIALAEQLGDTETLVHALTNVGTVALDTPEREQGLARIERAIALASSRGFHEHLVRAYTNIACIDIRRRDYAAAEASVERTLRFSEEHETETWELYILGWRARLELERGRWDAAQRDAEAVLSRYGVLTVVRSQPLVVMGLLRARRGEAGADELLAEALSLALSSQEIQRIGPAVAALAEAAWLRGELAGTRERIAGAFQDALRADDRWSQGQLALWLRRAGGATAPLAGAATPMDTATRAGAAILAGAATPADAATPYHLLLHGDWRGAADAWGRIGNPYEQALALAEGDDPQAWRAALAALDGLGAAAAGAAVRRDLRERGARRGIPRGPRARTRGHPAGLTGSQVRVLELLARGLTNADIARELYLSRRTVDHHVSAILAKLGVATRAQAIAAAHERRLLLQK